MPDFSAALTMQGAEPFLFKGNDTGCLLIHGFTGTPFEMRMLGENLHQAGYTVLAPRLFGHATRPADMIRARWSDWIASVEDGLNLLKGFTSRQVVMGLSMGGALALLTAARFPVAGVVSFSAPSALPGDWRIKVLPLIYPFYRYIPKGPPDWHNPEAAKDHREYHVFPTHSVIELNQLLRTMNSELSKITVPALFVQSHQDKEIPPQSLDTLINGISSADRTKLWLDNSGHVVIREPEREKVFLEVQNFLTRILNNL